MPPLVGGLEFAFAGTAMARATARTERTATTSLRIVSLLGVEIDAPPAAPPYPSLRLLTAFNLQILQMADPLLARTGCAASRGSSGQAGTTSIGAWLVEPTKAS